MDALITSSISKSAYSLIILEKTVLLNCAHQTIGDNIVLCKLENIGLAHAADSAVSAQPLAPASLPVHRDILSCAYLQTLFSKLEPCSTSESALPLSSVVLAALNDGLAEIWKWSNMESELLLKIHAGQNGNLCTSINEFEH